MEDWGRQKLCIWKKTYDEKAKKRTLINHLNPKKKKTQTIKKKMNGKNGPLNIPKVGWNVI